MEKQLIPVRILKSRLQDPTYSLGVTFLALSLILFFIPELSPFAKDSYYLNLFFGNHFLTCVYFLALLFSGRMKRGRGGLPLIILFLLLFQVGAFALNRSVQVFPESVTWFSVYLFIIAANCAAFAYQRFFPLPVRLGMFFLLGASLCVFLYLSIYIGMLAIIGMFAFFFFGLSLHAILPHLFFLYTIRLYNRHKGGSRAFTIAFFSGIGVTMLIAIVYTLIWRVNVVGIDKIYHKKDADNGLPGWVNVLQKVSPGPITQQVLTSDAAYVVPDSKDRFVGRRSSISRFQIMHDPLVMIAAFVAGTSDLSWEDRGLLLNAMDNEHADDEVHLWSDQDLVTTHVQTFTHIWPRLRTAYTEKIINVKNEDGDGRISQQEAIYKFHLPEGAVVSSLSLWIDGREEKGILTTKGKADSAYTAIVGYERRDPSVVHWREGNLVAVRVFPVIGGEERQFKLGITAPLSYEHGKLVYRNIDFDGPSVSRAREKTSISFETPPADLNFSPVFSKTSRNNLSHDGRYNEEWQLSLLDEGLKHQVFSNEGRMYTAMPYRREMGASNVTAVYLDINQTWHSNEVGTLLSMLPQQPVWVYAGNSFHQLTASNQSAIFQQLAAQRFSFFPFHLLPDPETALVITKSVKASPRISDIGASDFVVHMKNWMENRHAVMLFNLGGELSPYLRTLKECRTFRYDQGDLAALKTLLDTYQFPVNIENDQQVVIEAADMVITANNGYAPSTAPDHLQRLFAYNHIMQGMGPHLLTGGDTSSELVEEARKAHIVTPLSSLIVLETQQDYDRFNIKDSNDNLKNAALNNNGAVPEPHEWLLIAGAVLLIIYLKYRPSFPKRIA
ncbi:XrtN system VIT domain-containing protein [Chitinophaga rhizophila]|uniref:XrtN system VIT domain-containing protein n=1 Tax=Chitinophaga rhizophila TaxID=2866212 RepID=A0ABS7GJA2_9BACT|nr:XrtN system VIT domain-containing protein [Chitinophaga rhizophila]MBW8687456.1 XrtN system VIT domain-containing protein [Chitinophaga rhizophila]